MAGAARRTSPPRCGGFGVLTLRGGRGGRFEPAIYEVAEIPPYYDSMIGKLIVYARERTEAIRKMQAALCELVIQDVDNNIEEQIDLITRKEFVAGTYDLDFVK